MDGGVAKTAVEGRTVFVLDFVCVENLGNFQPKMLDVSHTLFTVLFTNDFFIAISM